MPGKRGKKNVGRNIKEFMTGGKYQATKKKFGKARARKQAIAVGLRQAGVARRRRKKR